MEQDEQAPDADLVRRLLRAQCPQLAGESVRLSATSGSSNWVFRVAEDRAVRLPRSDAYVADLRAEADLLPALAPRLGVPVPEVRFLAEPSADFPRPWTVVTWVPGENPGVLAPPGQRRLADDLGRFVRRLHGVDAGVVVPAPDRRGYRCGEPVTDEIDGWAERSAALLDDLFDPGHVREAWRRVRDVPPAAGGPCWVHTDLAGENLLTRPDGGLAGVVDFGGLGRGDPSVDLLYAWSLFDAPARERFFRASGADESTQLRARAWSFVGPGLMTIANYRASMPIRTAGLVRMVEAVAEEVGVRLR